MDLTVLLSLFIIIVFVVSAIVVIGIVFSPCFSTPQLAGSIMQMQIFCLSNSPENMADLHSACLRTNRSTREVSLDTTCHHPLSVSWDKSLIRPWQNCLQGQDGKWRPHPSRKKLSSLNAFIQSPLLISKGGPQPIEPSQALNIRC